MTSSFGRKESKTAGRNQRTSFLDEHEKVLTSPHSGLRSRTMVADENWWMLQDEDDTESMVEILENLQEEVSRALQTTVSENDYPSTSSG